jgi:acetyl esterase
MTPLLTRYERVALVDTRAIPTSQGSVKVRVVVPSEEHGPRPAIVWFHGGGFVIGDLDTAEPTARSLAVRTGAIVVCVGYRKAPESTLDDAYEDGHDALHWVFRHAGSLGIDAHRVAVGGDSAGGNIAAVVAQEHCASDEHTPLAAQLLVYPAVSHSHDVFPSKTENLDGGTLDRQAIRWFETHLAGAQLPGSDRYAPLRTADLSALPPAVIVTAGYDPLRDEGLAYHDRLRGAGVPSTLLHYADDVHGFFTMDGVLSNGRAAVCEAGDALAALLGSASVPKAPGSSSVIAAVTRPARKRMRRTAAWGAFVGDRVLNGQTRYQRRLLRLLGLPAGREVEALSTQLARLETQLRAVRRQLERPQDHPDEQ